MPTAFITGATGFIGRYLMDDLRAHGYAVTALTRTFEQVRALPPGVRPVAGDVTKAYTLRAGLRDADIVFHLAAARVMGRNPKERERLERINVEGTRITLELAAEMGARKIIYTSSANIFEPSDGIDETSPLAHAPLLTAYAQSKRTAHVEVLLPLQQRGAPVIGVSLGAVFGPRDASGWGQVMRAFARRRLPVMVGAEAASSWTFARDVATGLRLAAERGQLGENYLLGGPALTRREFFARGEKVSGWPAPRVWLPTQTLEALARVTQKFNPALTERLRTLAQASPRLRADKAQRDLGWTPTPFEDGLKETLTWLQHPPSANA